MKGYGIEIKNNLLEPKHIESMGISVWLYMFFLDKITSINEQGIGKVLGGKPLKYKEDIEEELNISERTYTRWVKVLKKSEYINATRTPHGLSISVNKAFKRFGKKLSDTPVMTDEIRQERRNTIQKVADVNKDSTVDNNSKTTERGSEDIEILIKSFENINPASKNFYGRNPQRNACRFLIDTYGQERVKSVIEKTLPKTNNLQFFPTIITPIQLQDKWASLESAIRKYQSEKLQAKEKYKII